MSDPNQRPFGSEPPLAFDDRRRPRRGGPAPVSLIVSLVLLVVVAGGVFYLYRGGVRGTNDAPQPVGAPLRDVRTPAPPQPQAADPAAGLSIYKDDPNTVSAPVFAPPPEQPAPRPGPSSTPMGATAPLVAGAQRTNIESATPKKATKPALKDRVQPIDTINAPTNRRPASIDGLLAADSAAPATPAAKSGPAVVQIGAFSSPILADQGWSAAAAVAPGAMAGKSKRVTPLTKDGVTLYRTSITGFASREAAQAVCDKLKAAGKTCFVR